METLEEAAKYGCNIVREVRYYAYLPNGGPQYALRRDWTTELLELEFKDDKFVAARNKAAMVILDRERRKDA